MARNPPNGHHPFSLEVPLLVATTRLLIVYRDCKSLPRFSIKIFRESVVAEPYFL